MVLAPLASWMLAAWGRRRPPVSLTLILAILRLTIRQRQRQPSDTEPGLRRDFGGQKCPRLRLRHGCEGGSRWNPRANISHSIDITIKKCKLLVTRHHGTFL